MAKKHRANLWHHQKSRKAAPKPSGAISIYPLGATRDLSSIKAEPR